MEMVTVLLCSSYSEGRWSLSQPHSPSCIWCLRRSQLVISPWAVTVFWTLPCFRPREGSCLGELGAGGCPGPLQSHTICSAAMLRGETLVLGGGTHSSQVSPSAACLSLWAVGARDWDPAALTGRLGYPSSMSLLNRNIIVKSREWGFLHCGHTWKKNK